MGDGNGTGMDLDAGDVRCNIVDMDGLGDLSDTSRGSGDVPRIRNSKNTTTNAIQSSNLSVEAVKWPTTDQDAMRAR